MTRSRRPSADGPGGKAEVVSIAARSGGRAGFRRLAAEQLAAARTALGMTHAEFADYLSPRLGYRPDPPILERWEQAGTLPAEVAYATFEATGGPVASVSLLDSVPNGLPAAAIAGPWVTAYQFGHGGGVRYHADIAHVSADGDREVRALNHPPPPRTQGRAFPFRNEIEGRLFGRHLIGTWRNVSDTRYYGALQLAVLPGETVMDGFYTGLASDISVSIERWRWVRLVPGDLSSVALREPSSVYELVMSRTQDDLPLTAADIGEDS